MSDQPVVAVRGEAVLEVEPEVARLDVRTVARDTDRKKTLRLLNDAAGEVDKVVQAFHDAIESVEATSVRVSPQLKTGRGSERVTGYVGAAQRVVTVTAFDRLGELVAQLARLDLAEVSGPWWSLRPISPAHRQARLQAVADARRRAGDYADALGARVEGLVELADTGLLADRVANLSQATPARAFTMAASAPEEFTFDLTPARQIVNAAVEARFRISTPDFGAP